MNAPQQPIAFTPLASVTPALQQLLDLLDNLSAGHDFTFSYEDERQKMRCRRANGSVLMEVPEVEKPVCPSVAITRGDMGFVVLFNRIALTMPILGHLFTEMGDIEAEDFNPAVVADAFIHNFHSSIVVKVGESGVETLDFLAHGNACGPETTTLCYADGDWTRLQNGFVDVLNASVGVQGVAVHQAFLNLIRINWAPDNPAGVREIWEALGSTPVAINIGSWTLAVQTSSTGPFISREEDGQPVHARTLTTQFWIGVNGRALATQSVAIDVEVDTAELMESAIHADESDVQQEDLAEI